MSHELTAVSDRDSVIKPGVTIDSGPADALLKTRALQNAILGSANFSIIATTARFVRALANIDRAASAEYVACRADAGHGLRRVASGRQARGRNHKATGRDGTLKRNRD